MKNLAKTRRCQGGATWTQAVEVYLADYGPSSAAQYGSSLRVFERWYRENYHGEEPDPASLTREEVRQYRAHLLGQGRAATVNGHLTAIRGLARSVGRREVSERIGQ